MSFEDKQTVCSDCWITARDAERKRILELFEHQQYRFGKAFVDEIIQIIKGEKK